MDNSEKNNKKEIFYFQCEKELKSKFYKFAQERDVSPGSLLRAFLRKVIKDWEAGKISQSSLDSTASADIGADGSSETGQNTPVVEDGKELNQEKK
jgi:hypothetical protein